MFSPLLTCVDAFRPSQQPQIVLAVVTAKAQPFYQLKAKSRHPGFFTSSQLKQIQQNCSKATTQGGKEGQPEGRVGVR